MACISNAVIVGGGIAGMAAAIALAKAGVECEVVEISATQQGASLGISGRAAMALVELGVYDAVQATGKRTSSGKTSSSVRDAAGNLLNAGPKRPTWPGAVDNVSVYRPVFVDILTAAAHSLGVTIRTGVTIESFENNADGIVAQFTDGQTGRYDLLVGGDGVGSKIRAALFPNLPKPAYSGQLSIRWLAEGPPIEPEGWYNGPVGRLGFYYLPQGMVYVPAVINMPELRRLSDDEVYALFERLLDSYTAPAVVELRKRLKPGAQLIGRPFEWILVPDRWYDGRAILIGDAAHATTAHMGMGGGMAIEDAAVLGQCIATASTLSEALDSFMTRRFERVRLVVETSVKLSHLEQEGVSDSDHTSLLTAVLQTLGQPY